jgi:hypothetical protein
MPNIHKYMMSIIFTTALQLPIALEIAEYIYIM